MLTYVQFQAVIIEWNAQSNIMQSFWRHALL